MRKLSLSIAAAVLLILLATYALRADGPPVVVIVNPTGLEPISGAYFIGTNIRGPITQNYRLIADDTGALLYSEPISPFGAVAQDWKRHGLVGPMSHRVGDCIALFDDSFSQYDEFCASGDYEGERVDVHDFIIDSQGDGWIMLYRDEPADLSPHGGPVSGTIEMSVIQRIDAITRGVTWQIRADEWLTLDDATVPLTNPVRTVPNHINSYDLCDKETTILISNRNVDEVVKIRLADRAILWRLGGKNATVELSDGVENYKQHDARCVDDADLISIFDDGDETLRPYSRAVVYQVDAAAGTATLVYEYRHSPDIFAPFTGNFQYLPEIDRGLIHWGGAPFVDPDVPNVTEVRLSDGATVQELHLPGPMISYRITKAPWPVTRRYLPWVSN